MDQCPCGSDLEYSQCCEPFIKGESFPQTAEKLMRSRYTAFVKTEIDYLYTSTLPSQREGHDAQSSKEWAENSQWHGLTIISTKGGGPDDLEGEVEFKANFSQNGQPIEHQEIATFKKEEDRWYFEDGEGVAKKPFVRKSPKVGRNDPCPCKSGKKYKKCCGANN